MNRFCTGDAAQRRLIDKVNSQSGRRTQCAVKKKDAQNCIKQQLVKGET